MGSDRNPLREGFKSSQERSANLSRKVCQHFEKFLEKHFDVLEGAFRCFFQKIASFPHKIPV